MGDQPSFRKEAFLFRHANPHVKQLLFFTPAVCPDTGLLCLPHTQTHQAGQASLRSHWGQNPKSYILKSCGWCEMVPASREGSRPKKTSAEVPSLGVGDNWEMAAS